MGEFNRHEKQGPAIPPPAVATTPNQPHRRLSKLKFAILAVALSTVLALVHRWMYVIRPEVLKETEAWMANPFERLQVLEHGHHGHWRGAYKPHGGHDHGHHKGKGRVLNGKAAAELFT